MISKLTNLTPKQILKIWVLIYVLTVLGTGVNLFYAKTTESFASILFSFAFYALLLPLFPIVGGFGFLTDIIRFYSGNKSCFAINIDPQHQVLQVIILFLCLTFTPSLIRNWRKASGCAAIVITTLVFFYLLTYLIFSICFSSLPIPSK